MYMQMYTYIYASQASQSLLDEALTGAVERGVSIPLHHSSKGEAAAAPDADVDDQVASAQQHIETHRGKQGDTPGGSSSSSGLLAGAYEKLVAAALGCAPVAAPAESLDALGASAAVPIQNSQDHKLCLSMQLAQVNPPPRPKTRATALRRPWIHFACDPDYKVWVWGMRAACMNAFGMHALHPLKASAWVWTGLCRHARCAGGHGAAPGDACVFADFCARHNSCLCSRGGTCSARACICTAYSSCAARLTRTCDQVLLEELEMLVEPVLMYRHSGVYEPGRYFGAGSGELGEGGDGDEDVRASIAGSSVVLVSTTEALAADDADVRSGCFSLLAAKVRAQEDARKVRAVLTRVQLALDGFHAPNDTDATAEGSPRPLSRMPLATRRGSSAARESADVLAADVQVGALASMLRASLCACVGTSVCMHACTHTHRQIRR